MTRNFHNEGEPPSVRRRSSLPLILWLVGGGILLVLLVCGGIVFWLFRGMAQEMPAAQANAEEFLQALRTNRIDEAYAQTSPAFQAKTSLEQFRAFLKTFPVLTTHTSSTLALQGMHTGTLGTQARFGAQLIAPNGQGTCTLTLTKQGDAWMIHHVNVQF